MTTQETRMIGEAGSFAAESLVGGFKEPVFGSQAVFHALMSAMARPGTIHALAGFVTPPAPVNAAAAAMLASLCDADTTLWIDPVIGAESAARSWFTFQTGTRLTSAIADATFALVVQPKKMPGIASMEQGSAEYPDRSTTLVIQVDRLSEGGGLVLEGPGIETTVTLGVEPLPAFFREAWVENNARFPRGVDVVFASPSAIACLPRTTRIIGGPR